MKLVMGEKNSGTDQGYARISIRRVYETRIEAGRGCMRLGSMLVQIGKQ